jgi:hypothetical protein
MPSRAGYKVHAALKGTAWIAWAENAEDGARFGIECAGSTEADAVGRLTRWLDWQHEHAAALAALQDAEHDYHRTIAGSAFAGADEAPSAEEMQRDALKAVEAARLRLDEVRATRPE